MLFHESIGTKPRQRSLDILPITTTFELPRGLRTARE
jgi:hypothetical protein